MERLRNNVLNTTQGGKKSHIKHLIGHSNKQQTKITQISKETNEAQPTVWFHLKKAFQNWNDPHKRVMEIKPEVTIQGQLLAKNKTKTWGKNFSDFRCVTCLQDKASKFS